MEFHTTASGTPITLESATGVNPPAFNLRLSEDLNQKLREAAEQNKRSLNAEINYRLQASFGSYRR